MQTIPVQTIEKFKSTIRKGIAKSNLFHVELPRIPGVNISGEDLNILCKNVQLPARSISTADRVIGIVTEKVANTFVVDDISLSFHVTNDYNIKRYIESWMNLAVNNDTYELGYKYGNREDGSGYAKEVVIHQLAHINSETTYPINNPLVVPGGLSNPRSEKVYTCVLEGAFPTSMNNIELQNDLDGLVEMSLSLTYTNWRSK
tara:strand:+ start:269 stop:877 length:609 start_codon:yes stop_codon:yes gene_type:complete